MNRKALALLGILAFLILFRPASAEAPPRRLTIEECIDLGVKVSKGLHASGMRVEASEAKAKEANAARLPTLKFGAGYTRLSQVPPFEVSLPILPTKLVVSQNYFNNYLIKIGLLQPIFTGFKLESAADMARFNMKAAEQDMAMDRADLVYDIRAAYWNLYQAREFVKVVDESEAQIQAHLSDVKNMFDQGLMTRNEVLRAEVQLSNVRLARIDAGNAVEMAGVVLNSLLGLPLDTEVALATEISDPAGREDPPSQGSEPVAGPESLASEAQDVRPDVKAMELRVKASEAGVKAAKAGWYPQVFLSGNYYDMRPNSRLLPARDKFYSTWDVSLNISMDLWNWGTTARQTQQARAQLAQTADALGQMKDAVAVEVRQCWLNLRKSREKIAVGRASVAQAEENLRVTTERFKEGVALNADVLDAEVALLQARTNRTQSLVEMELARARLEKARGR
jgi:outer membrane protein TolC